jgi:hypothetical protein
MTEDREDQLSLNALPAITSYEVGYAKPPGHSRFQKGTSRNPKGRLKGAKNKRLHDEWLDTALTYKVEWERELARRERLGIIAEYPVPHPDHVQIDMSTGAVTMAGPWTKQQKAELDLWHEHKEIFLEERETLLQEIATCKDEAQAESLREDLAKTDKVLEIIQRAVPGDPEGTLP